jgi:glutamine transport system substrate-binding protein
MKKYKIILPLFLVLLLVLTACGNAGETSSDTSSAESKKITIGTGSLAGAFYPIIFKDKGELAGFDIDIAKAVAKEAGYEYEIKEFGWEPLFAATQGKQIDLAITAIGITDERKETYDFSIPYFESTHVIIVKEGSDIKSALDLKGKKVGVANGSTAQIAVENAVGNENLTQYDETPFMQLINGDVEAIVTDNVPALEFMKSNPNEDLQIIEDKENFESEYYAIMFPKGSELKGEIDVAVKKLIQSENYKEIYIKWLGEEPDVDALLQAGESK